MQPVRTRVLLTGMMGAGKTTVGRELASITAWPYLDNDDLVARAVGRPASEVLALGDEMALRAAESAALDAGLGAEPPVVVGVAAGALLDPTARDRMRAAGFVVYLRVPLEVLASRVGDGSGRPWLSPDPIAEFERLFAGREPLYEGLADLILEADQAPPTELARQIHDAVA